MSEKYGFLSLCEEGKCSLEYRYMEYMEYMIYNETLSEICKRICDTVYRKCFRFYWHCSCFYSFINVLFTLHAIFRTLE